MNAVSHPILVRDIFRIDEWKIDQNEKQKIYRRMQTTNCAHFAWIINSFIVWVSFPLFFGFLRPLVFFFFSFRLPKCIIIHRWYFFICQFWIRPSFKHLIEYQNEDETEFESHKFWLFWIAWMECKTLENVGNHCMYFIFLKNHCFSLHLLHLLSFDYIPNIICESKFDWRYFRVFNPYMRKTIEP